MNEQEPVAWMVYTQDGQSVYITDNPMDIQDRQQVLPLYTTPPQRPWVGLTNEEVKEIIDTYTIDDHGFDIWCDGLGVVKAVDDKLRSKNT